MVKLKLLGLVFIALGELCPHGQDCGQDSASTSPVQLAEVRTPDAPETVSEDSRGSVVRKVRNVISKSVNDSNDVESESDAVTENHEFETEVAQSSASEVKGTHRLTRTEDMPPPPVDGVNLRSSAVEVETQVKGTYRMARIEDLPPPPVDGAVLPSSAVEVETEVKEAKSEVKEAKSEVKEAKTEVKEAKIVVKEAKAPVHKVEVEVSSQTEATVHSENADELATVHKRMTRTETNESHVYEAEVGDSSRVVRVARVDQNESFLQSESEDTAKSSTEAHMTVAMMPGGGSMFGGLFLCAVLVAVWTKIKQCCMGDNSCWYWPFCMKMRWAAGMDKFEVMTLRVTVHRTKEVEGTGDQHFIAVVPRRKGQGKKKPILAKDATHMKTSMSTDGIYEEELDVYCPQGFTELQFALMSPPGSVEGIIRSPTCLGYAGIKVSKLFKGSPIDKQVVQLTSDGKFKVIGTVCVSLRVVEEKAGRKKKRRSLRGKNVDAALLSEDEDADDDGDDDEEEEEEKDPIARAEKEAKDLADTLHGPLDVTDRVGNYERRHFVVTVKNGIYIWEYYKEKNPSKSTVPEGRFPFATIIGVQPVSTDQSQSEFAIKFENHKKRVEQKIFKRVERPRDQWVKNINALKQVSQELLKMKKKKGVTK